MKMKNFSILLILVCIGFVLMLAGSTAHAAAHDTEKAKLAVEIDPTKDAGKYLEGEDPTVEFQLHLGGGPAVMDPKNALIIDWVGLKLLGMKGGDPGPRGKPVDPDWDLPLPKKGDTVMVGANGKLSFLVEITGTSGDQFITARFGQQEALARFQYEKQAFQPILVVLPPQETAKPSKPSTLDPTWPDPTWVDYCADPDGERPLTPELRPIHLADGPRKTQNASAQTYRQSVGNLFTAVIEIRDVEDLSAWQMDVAFNPQILRALKVTEGNFLAKDDFDPFFIPGFINNDVGVITGIAQARVGRKAALTTDNPEGVSTGANMAGILFCIDFQVLEYAEESLGLHNVQLSDARGERISYWTAVNPVVVTHKFPAQDVNRDRVVGIMDLMAVAGAMPPPDGDGGRNLGRANPINPRADVNDDGIVNALDLIAVSSHASWGEPVEPQDMTGQNRPNRFVGPTAPALVGDLAALTPSTIQGWIDIAQVEDDGSAIFDLGIANLERLLQATVPERTKLLLNYPNPFNPETWIPYQLAKATDVSVSIYSVNGALVRTLALGHQAAGVYQSKSQAAYWDGRNELGERVASGVYFYTLTAGDFSATGKMLVRK